MAEVSGGNLTLTRIASGNLSQYRMLSFSGRDVFMSTTSGAVVLGVSQTHPNDNEHATLVGLGHTKIQLANSLGDGIEIMAGATGFAVEAQSGQYVAGTLITGATSGGIGEMNFHPYHGSTDPNP